MADERSTPTWAAVIATLLFLFFLAVVAALVVDVFGWACDLVGCLDH